MKLLLSKLDICPKFGDFMIKMENYFIHPTETWTTAQCEKAVKQIARDGMGNPYPFKGAHPGIKGIGEYEKSSSSPYNALNGKQANNGTVRYNGGKVIGDKWYEGEIFQLPILPKGFKWVYRSTWCWRIVKT